MSSGDLGTTEEKWRSGDRLTRLRPLVQPAATHVVLVAPHPDDEVLGAGGLLQTLVAAGCRVDVVWVTDGEACVPTAGAKAQEILRTARISESQCALGRLGCSDFSPHRLRLTDGAVAGAVHELADRLAGLLVPGSLCVAPWSGDGHPDHDATGRAAALASRHQGAQLMSYLVWAWHWTTPEQSDIPWPDCRRWDLSRRAQARKRWATAAFTSQIRPTFPTDGATGASSYGPVLPAAVLRRFWRPFEVYAI